MTIGEMRQLLSHDRLSFDEEAYDLLIRSKTASLLAGACEVGALGAPAEQRAALARFGDALGMIFQIVDDVLDYTEDEAVTGKPSGLDLREHKVTLPLIAALPRLSDAGRRDVTQLMRTEQPDAAQVARVIGLVTEAGGLDYARERAQHFAEIADAELDRLPPSPARESLRASITYVLERRS
jgi:octaprenyl-diphosphate synthase